jgi:glycosyltransferase involved in cell wall biosynthesis
MLGVPSEKPVVLYASKFIPRTHPDELIRAASALRRKGLDFSLVMVGAGEMEDELRSLVVELGLDQVVFPGFVNQHSQLSPRAPLSPRKRSGDAETMHFAAGS